MWQNNTRGKPYPTPWWLQQNFNHWINDYDTGLFSSKEAALASNALYRYWNMVGVKDHHQESLIGQAGEIEPVYDRYSLAFFLFDPATKKFSFPQQATGNSLRQQSQDGYLPVMITTYQSDFNIDIEEKVLATTVGVDQRSVVLVRFKARPRQLVNPTTAWFCIAVSATGPSGFQRHDKAGRYIADRRISYMRYLKNYSRLEVNETWGPVFDTAPDYFGLYGNISSLDPSYYLANNPYLDLEKSGSLNGVDECYDHVAGIASAVFAWPITLTSASSLFCLDIRLPVDDYRGIGDLVEMRTADANALETANADYWKQKLDKEGLQAKFPSAVSHLFDLYRICRSNLLILADNGEIHPGPTIYDSFWVRDSSVEGIACALAGDMNLAERQFGHHYRRIFNFGQDRVGPACVHGLFAGEHEKNDREWDSNGQALWAIGRFDRIRGTAAAFGAGMFSPYVIDGSRWIRDNRSEYGLLHSGWSAEHIGDRDKPHYWDDFWAIAGLWEAGKLAERIQAPQAGEIWSICDDLRRKTAESIRWVLTEQRKRGHWETFIPTGPADVGRLDSTVIGAVSYFHPTRLYMGRKLGDDIDLAARLTLETIWSHFIDGGFKHDCWNCYGPYLTLQLAHAFLLIGDIDKMDRCLSWAVWSAFPKVSRGGAAADVWDVACGAWNEQHCYPVAKDFSMMPDRSWYMGDIPHGWASAEFMLLLRDILFFEADDDAHAHIYLAPGVPHHWVKNGERIEVVDAPTIFGSLLSFTMSHDSQQKQITIDIAKTPQNVPYVYPCRFGGGVLSLAVDGKVVAVSGNDIILPAGMRNAVITYR